MFDLVRSMREQWEGDVGDFTIYDERDEKVGSARFTLPEEYCAVASSTWGKIEVRSYLKEGRQTVSIDGSLLATLVIKGMASRFEIKMAAGQELVLKHALFSDTLHHRSEIVEIEFKYKNAVEKTKPGECRISISGSCGARSEDIALAFMAWYGFMRVSSVDAWQKSGW